MHYKHTYYIILWKFYRNLFGKPLVCGLLSNQMFMDGSISNFVFYSAIFVIKHLMILFILHLDLIPFAIFRVRIWWLRNDVRGIFDEMVTNNECSVRRCIVVMQNPRVVGPNSGLFRRIASRKRRITLK